MTNKKNVNSASTMLIPMAVAIVITTIIFQILKQALDYRMASIALAITYFVIHLLVARLYHVMYFSTSTNSSEDSPHPAVNWPLVGPVGKMGRPVIAFNFIITSILSVFNPFLFVRQFRLVVGQFDVAKRLAQNEQANTQYQTKVKYRLPFDGQWLIFSGGNTQQTSHSWNVLAQRYAYDFVMADENYARHSGKGARLHDYYCYEKPVLAAADGEVIAVENNIGNAIFVGFYMMDFLCRNFAGNHVIIRHADGEYGFYAHMIKGSISIKPGDKIKCGESIGRCGFSGHTSEPHLHFHIQDDYRFYRAMGLPIKFDNVELDGVLQHQPVALERGTRVKHVDNH